MQFDSERSIGGPKTAGQLRTKERAYAEEMMQKQQQSYDSACNTVAPPQGEIAVGLNELHNYLDRLTEIGAALSFRLEGILSPKPPADIRNESVPCAATSVGSSIAEATLKVRQIRCGLSDILAAIEL